MIEACGQSTWNGLAAQPVPSLQRTLARFEKHRAALGHDQESTIFAGCVYVFHQLAMAARPGLTGKGNSLLNKIVKKLHLAECSKLHASQRQRPWRQVEATVQAEPS